MTIFGLTRCRNESRWIHPVIEAALPLCERFYVFDDHSSEGTPELCERMGDKLTVIRSPFDDVTDERRDKQHVLDRIMAAVSDIHLRGNEQSPFWILAIDSDELLDPSAIPVIRANLAVTKAHAFKLPIRYLWDSDLSLVRHPGHRRVRVDGVYRTFARPSIFRLFNGAFKFQSTPWGGNFHCSSIPQELLGHAHEMLPAPIWHLGYNDKADRMRKYAFYNRVDPNNQMEDQYKHICQGDLPEIPATMKLKWAGPMQFEMM